MENKFLGLLDAVTSSYSGSFNTDKETAIIAANQRKLEDLAKYRKQREAEELKASLTLAGRMGLKPNEDPVLHTLVNTAAAGYSSLSRHVGQGIAAVVDTAREGFDSNSIPQEVREARARQLNGTATLQDIDMLNAPVGYNSITQVPEKMTPYHRKQLERSGTNLDRIAQWEETQNLVADIKGAFDRSSVVDNRAREERERDVRENHKIDTVGDKAVSVLKQIVDHPRAALLDIGENAPQLAAGILGGGLGTAAVVGAYAVDEYQQALQDYRNKNNGAMPSKEWMQERQALGAALAVPEYVGDRLTLGAGKVVKEASKTAGKVVDSLEEGFKKSLLSASAKATNNMATRGAASTLLAGTGEYVTEDIQTIIEKKMKDEKASEMERHLAGSAGFAGGAGFHAGIPAVTAPFAVAGAIKEGREAAALARETATTETEAVKQAEESNDLTALLDKKSPAFSPDKALGVLHKKSLDESNTPEQRTEYQAQAKEIMDLFEKQYKAAELSSSAKYEENVAALEEAKKQLADTDPNSPDYAEAKMFADLLEDEVSKGAPDPDQEAKRKKDMEVLQGKLAQAEKIYEAFTNDTVNASLKDLDVGATVALADSQVDVADTEGQAKAQDAVKKVVLLSMASPDSLTADQAEALAKNTNNALGDNDRAYLNQFAQASRAMTQLKSMAQVSKEVMYGDDSIGQLGLEGYQYRMGKFLAAGDAKRADRLMEGLTNFLASHQSKYAALKGAEAKAQNGQRMQVVKRDGEWFAEPQTLPREELRKNKWYEVNPASIGSKFISNVGTELDAIISVHKALGMASGLVSGASTTTTAAAKPTQASTPATVLEQQPAATSLIEPPNDVQESTTTLDQGVEDLEVTEVTEVEQDSSAKLTALQNSSTPASQWLKQTVTRKPESKNQSLLTAVPALLDTLQNDGSLDRLNEFVDGGVTDADSETLGKVQELYSALEPRIRGLLKRSDRKFKDNDAVLDDLFIDGTDGKPDLDQNVKIAMALAGLAWVRDAVGNGPYNDDETINKMLSQPKEAKVTSEVRGELGTGYTRYALAANSIGKQAVKALGIKASKDAPKNYLPLIENALGTYALEAMVDAGYAQVKEVKDSVVQSWLGKTSDKNHSHTFVTVPLQQKRVGQQTKAEWADDVKGLTDYFKGESKGLDRLFDVQSQLTWPSLTPPGFTQKKVSKSSKGIPKVLEQYLKKANNTPYTVEKNVWRFLTSLENESLQHELIGLDMRPPEHIHGDEAKAVEAKNAGKLRGLENLKEFIKGQLEPTELGLDQPVYFSRVMWNNQRVGEDAAINMQTDKTHRYAFTTKAWDTEIKMSDDEMLNKFKLRVLESFGVKTDQKNSEDALNSTDGNVSDWDKWTKDPMIQAGMAVLQEQLKDEAFKPTLDQQKAVVAATKKGDENMHSFAGLMALAAYANAVDAGAESFNTNLTGEIDGVNNGPILTLLYLGVQGLSALAEKGGFFKKGSGYTNANRWKAVKGNLDIYQTATKNFLQQFGGNIADTPLYENLFYFTGHLGTLESIEKDGRNLAKTPNTAFFFGSGIGSLRDGLIKDFETKIIRKITEVAQIKDQAEQESARKTLIENINALAPVKAQLPLDTSIQTMMRQGFMRSRAVAGMAESFDYFIGEPFAKTLSESYQEVSHLRNQVTTHSTIMYSLYDHVYRGMKEGMIRDMVEKGEITKEHADKWDLHAEQEARLKEILKDLEPTVQSAMSQQDSNEESSLASALPVLKQRNINSDSPRYSRGVKLNRKADRTNTNNVRAASRTNSADEVRYVEPGVGMMAKMIHSSDSAKSHSVNPDYGSLNVHDARITGLKYYSNVGVEFNQATFNILMAYSPLREIYEARVRQLEALAKLKEDPQFKDIVEKAFNDSEKARWEAIKPAKKRGELFVPAANVAELFFYAQQADMNKLSEMAEWEYVDQYGSEGGQYEVTDKDRETVQRKINTLITYNYIPESVYQTIQKATGQRPTKYSNKEPQNRVASDLDMTVFFRENVSVSGTEAVEFLNRLLTKRNQDNTFNAYLLDKIAALVPEKINVTLVKDRKDVSPELYAENSRGWTDGNGNVYLLDPSQDHSGLTPELLLHELVHSVLRQVIDSPKSKEQKEAVAALETLLKSTRESMDKAGTSGEFKAALSNLQEFVAWGATNYNFQKQLAATKVRKSNLMEQFKDKLTRLAHTVFGLNQKDSTEVAKSAFGKFMVNFEKLVESSGRQVIQPGLFNGDLLSMASPNQQQYFGTQAVFDSLSGRGISDDFTQKLQGLMDDVINKLHGPYGAIKAVVQQRVGETASDAWAYALATNQRLMGSRIQNSGLTFSEKEGFVAEQVEATVRAALEDKASANSLIYREVEKLYHQAKEALKGKIDPNVYKFVFSVQGNNGRSDYLSRFAALGLASESFNKALEFETKAPEFVLKGKTFMERLETVWRYAVDWASTKLTKGYFGQDGNVRLNSLIGQLVQSELRAQDQVNGKTSIFGLMDILDTKTKGGVDFVKDAVLKVANSSTVKDSSMSLVKATGTLARIIAGDNVDKVIEGVNKLHNDMVKGRPGTAIALMNYIKGPKQWMDELVRSTKQVEKERLFVVNSRAKSVLSAFENKGENLTKEDKEAVSYVMLRTGMHYLFDSFGLNGIQELLEDRTKLSSAISTELANLSGFREQHFYIKQAKGLAVLLTTGIPDVENQLMNASNIARLYDTGKAVPAHADQVAPIIERLVSLYALEYSERSHVSRALDLMRSEGARNNGNGIEMVLKTAKYLDQQAREKTFAGNEALMIHGYTAEITDPGVEFDVARTPEEGEALVNKGYELVGGINLDKFDTDQRPATLYVQRGGGQRRYQSGAVSTSGMRAKGTQRHNNFYNMNTPEGTANAWSKLQMGIDNRKAVLEQFKPDPTYNPKVRRKNRNVAIPVLNKHGTAVDYRYEMSHQNRDSILKRDNRFEHILGVMDGSTYDKVASREQNKKVMQTLRTHYQDNYGSSPNDFVHIHSSSDDAEMKEIWAMIPDNTKKDIEQIWGKTGIYVPKEMLDALFGYRKASMADIFDKETKNYMERMFVSLVEGSIYHGALFKGKSQQDAQRLSRQSAIWVRRTEDVWQSLVHEAKDTIVVKTVKVLWDNVVSNTFMLMMKGVPIKNIFRDQHIALKGIMDYERDRNALTQLKAKLDTDYDTQDLEEIKSEIARLEDAINRNPIKEMIDAGMVPTIADDVAMEDDQYSYKSQLVNWMGEKTQNWNKDLVRAGEVAYMKHDTTAYKFLSKATQHSDFVARYALFKHQTTRKHNPLSKKDAFFQASEAFVNYDLNLPKKMQYLDDMGLLPFIKYFFSIQRVLARNLKDDPLSVLNTIAFSQFLGGLPIPTDSSIVVRLGNNPIGSGFWAFPSTLPELGTVQATMALVD